MGFLNDTESANLVIRRMILHVVGGEEEFEAQAEQSEIEHEDFFAERIRKGAVDGVHSFEEHSDTRTRLEQIARQETSFEAGGQEIARAFSTAHVGASTPGAFFLFELGAGPSTLLYSLVKYDYRNVLELVSAGGKRSFRPILQAFVTERRAIQKSCLVRFQDGRAEPLVSAFDRMGSAPDLTDYFRKFLGVSRARSDNERSSSRGDMLRPTLAACKALLPGGDAVAALERAKESLRGRPSVDDSAVREAIFVGSGAPEDQGARDELDKAINKGLKRHRLAGIAFRPSGRVLARPPRRLVKTAEKVDLSYPGEEEGRSVTKERDPEGGWVITIRTRRELVEDGTLPARLGRSA